MKDWNTCGAVIVSWDISHGKDKAVLLVGKQNKGVVDVINVYQSEEAIAIREKLLTKAATPNA